MRLSRFHRTWSAQRGVALVIVMLMLLAMGILAGVFAYSMKVEAKLATNTDAGAELTWVGISGVEFAKWMLFEQGRRAGQQGYNSLDQFWAGGSGDNSGPGEHLEQEVNPFEGLSLRRIPIDADTWVALEIIDQERKLNINQADVQVLEAALNLAGAGATDASAIHAALKDWIDRDDLPTAGGGAESTDYYLRQNPAYRAKNGPIDDVSELLKVRGVTPELYWGEKSVPRRPSPQGPTSENLSTVGLEQLFCSLSSGQININTAPQEVLQVALKGDASAARQIIQLRAEEPAKNPADLGRLLGPAWVGGQRNPFTTLSSTFEVRVEAHLGRATQRFVATIQRRGRDFQTLVFREQ